MRVRRNVDPVENDTVAQYSNILQGKATNSLSKVSKKSMKYDNRINVSSTIHNEVMIRLENSEALNLNVQTHKVLDALILKLTSNFSTGNKATSDRINKYRIVNLSLDEYMNLCGLKDRKEAKKQLKAAIQSIYNISMKWSEVSYEGKKKVERNWQVRVADAMGEEWFEEPVKRSGVTFKFAFDIADYLSHAYIMPYPEKLFQINSRYNPHAYYLGRKLVDHYNQNQGKKNGNRILVSTLLKCLPDLPKYEDTEHVFQLIMSPFDRDLDALVDDYGILRFWEYCDKDGVTISEDQLKNVDYSTWVNFFVLFEPLHFPKKRISSIQE